MFKKLAVIIIILALGGGGAWYLYTKGYLDFVEHTKSLFLAVPQTTSFIIEAEDLSELNEVLLETSYGEITNKLPVFHQLSSNNVYLDTLFDGILERPVLMAAHYVNSAEFDYIYFFDYSNKISANPLKELLDRYQTGNVYSISEGYYNNLKIYTFRKPDSEKVFSCAFHKGIFMGSFSGILLEKAIDQANAPSGIDSDPLFQEVRGLTGKNYDVTLYINYKTFSLVLNSVVNNRFKPSLEFFDHFASWCELDVSFEEDKILFSGYSVYNDTLDNLLNSLKAQKPKKIEVTAYLPENTAALVWVGMDDYRSFYEEKVLKGTSGGYFSLQILPAIGNELALVYTSNYSRENQTGIAAFIEQEEETALSEPLSFVSEILDSAFYEKYMLYQVSDQSVREHLSGKKVFENLFYNVFDEIVPRYWSVLGKYVVLANDLPTLKGILFKYHNQEILTKRIEYIKFSQNLSSESNVVVYLNMSKGNRIAQDLFNKNLYKNYPELSSMLDRFSNVGIELTNTGNKFYTSMSVQYNKEAERKDLLVKEIDLDRPVLAGPAFVKNHENGEHEILLQDKSNTLQLLDMKGNVIWQRDIDEKIESDIHQIDYYENNKLQYLFNTKNSIHIIDRNGRYVQNYPKRLPASATSPVAVMDYDSDKNYRFFIACGDGNIYGYRKSGALLPGWNPKRGIGKITRPLQHFLVEGKDYLIAANEAGKVFLFDRKGDLRTPVIDLKTRLSSEFYIDTSGMSFKWMAADTAGILCSVTLEGKQSQWALGAWPGNKTYYFGDIDGDQQKEHLFITSKEVTAIKADSTKLFQFSFPDDILVELIIFSVPDIGKYMAFRSVQSDQLYLLNGAGSLVEGFPVKGSTRPDYVMPASGKILFMTATQYSKINLYNIK